MAFPIRGVVSVYGGEVVEGEGASGDLILILGSLVARVVCRDLLSIDSRLNQIDPSKNISRPIQNGDTEPNSKYSLKKYLQIV